MAPVDRTRRTSETIAERYHERTKDNRSHLPALDRFVDALPPDPLVLDAGCGTGRDLRLLRERGCRVVGLDLAAAPLRVARDHEPAAALVRGDLRALPVASESVDGVYALSSLLHVPRDDLDRALAGVYEALRPPARSSARSGAGRTTPAAPPTSGARTARSTPAPTAPRRGGTSSVTTRPRRPSGSGPRGSGSSPASASPTRCG